MQASSKQGFWARWRRGMRLGAGYLFLFALLWSINTGCIGEPGGRLAVRLVYAAQFEERLQQLSLLLRLPDQTLAQAKLLLERKTRKDFEKPLLLDFLCSTLNEDWGNAPQLVVQAYNGETVVLEGVVAFPREVCEFGEVTITLWPPRTMGNLVARQAAAGGLQSAIVKNAGVWGHAASVLEDGRLLITGGYTSLERPLGSLLPFVGRIEGAAFVGEMTDTGVLYDPMYRVLRSIRGLSARAFHSSTLDESDDEVLLVGGLTKDARFAETSAFYLPDRKNEEKDDLSEISVKPEGEGIVEAALHQAFPLREEVIDPLEEMVFLGGMRPLAQEKRLCAQDERAAELHYAAMVKVKWGSEEGIVITGGLAITEGQRVLPVDATARSIWYAPLNAWKGKPALCIRQESDGRVGVRMVTDTTQEILPLASQRLPDARVGHSMTAVDQALLLYGGFAVNESWGEDAASVIDRRIFLGARRDALWLWREDGGNWRTERVRLPLADPDTDDLGCKAPLLDARALHQATRLRDGRILLSGGVRCDNALNCRILQPRHLLLYTPAQIAAGTAPPNDVIVRCVSWVGTEPTQARVFHTATLMPSGEVILWGGLTEDPFTQKPVFADRPEIFFPEQSAFQKPDNTQEPEPYQPPDGSPWEPTPEEVTSEKPPTERLPEPPPETPCSPTQERCNGMDDDCDGKIDEELTRPCYDGPLGTAGTGQCRRGLETCINGTWSRCVGQILPSTQLCTSGKDEDCNGKAGNDDSYCCGTFGTELYCWFREQKTWTGARDACQAWGGVLASVENEAQNNYLAGITQNGTWLGGTYDHSTQKGVWLSGKNWNYTNWATSEPNNAGGNEKHIELNAYSSSLGNGFWNDAAEDQLFSYACERTLVICARDADCPSVTPKCDPAGFCIR